MHILYGDVEAIPHHIAHGGDVVLGDHQIDIYNGTEILEWHLNHCHSRCDLPPSDQFDGLAGCNPYCAFQGELLTIRIVGIYSRPLGISIALLGAISLLPVRLSI